MSRSRGMPLPRSGRCWRWRGPPSRWLGRALLLVFVLAARAAADDPKPTPEQVTERTRGFASLWNVLRSRVAGLRVRADQSVLSSGEFDGARLWWLRSGLELQAGAPITDKISLGISPSIAWERLLVDGSDAFVVSQNGRDVELDEFLDTELRVGTSYRISETWAIEGVTGFSARHEHGAEYREAAQAGGTLAVSFRRDSWLRARLGLGIGPDIDDGRLRISPVYRILYRPIDSVTLEASGLRGRVEWQVTARTRLALDGGVEARQYKLDQRGDPPVGPGDGTLQRRQGRLQVEARYQWHERLRLHGAVGLVLDEKIEIVDEDDFEVARLRERDPSATLQLGFEWRL